MDDITNILSGNVDFENLTQSVYSFDVKVDADGVPIQQTKISVDKVNPQGLQVIRAINNTSPQSGVDGQPFISFTPEGGNLIKVDNIAGLKADADYSLTIIVY